jgi:hypothetical protein
MAMLDLPNYPLVQRVGIAILVAAIAVPSSYIALVTTCSVTTSVVGVDMSPSHQPQDLPQKSLIGGCIVAALVIGVAALAYLTVIGLSRKWTQKHAKA